MLDPVPDLVQLSERLLVACDQCYAGESLIVGQSHLEPFPDPPLESRFPPPYVSNFTDDLVAFRIENPDTGFKCVIYQNVVARELIVAMAGTDGADIKDWWGNVTHYGWNQWDKDRVTILQALDDLIARTRGPNDEQPGIFFTGQSLGGGLSQYAAYEFSETHQTYPSRSLSLITFNALGGVAALNDEIPNRGSLANLNAQYPGFTDSTFLPSRASAFGTIAHFSNLNDLVSRVGAGHFGGNVVSFPGRDFDHLNVATHDPYLLDTISAHKIETGYYYPLAEYV
ncbi:MAG: hypothetical protein ACREVC_05850, partial [Burkholderiales bacterium]